MKTFNLMFVILSSMSCENVKQFTDHMDFKSGSTNWSSWLRTDSRKGNRKGARCNSSRSSDKCFDSLTTRFITWPSERSTWGPRHSTLMSMSASLSSTRTITRQRCCFVFFSPPFESMPWFPQFQTHKYWVDIPEDTPGGTPVLQVKINQMKSSKKGDLTRHIFAF